MSAKAGKWNIQSQWWDTCMYSRSSVQIPRRGASFTVGTRRGCYPNPDGDKVVQLYIGYISSEMQDMSIGVYPNRVEHAGQAEL
ncbi:hypothetical protein BPAE_0115g00030 [Botrytis paeoniae]|uniref:Uncharacterized protein n=1 Tax=Botrytis paeoniae TaxID=278948 RepID=A0A4Z1FGM2_9HELO|nr:hypothetical protein BPAE_0115g00030 [Botrytis paeoniae]